LTEKEEKLYHNGVVTERINVLLQHHFLNEGAVRKIENAVKKYVARLAQCKPGI